MSSGNVNGGIGSNSTTAKTDKYPQRGYIMAVVQISKIQIRRGQKNTGTGLPQLASGEMAWAVDTQELFIGNGSVSEGAPAVGNTKIITSNDLASESNLFGLVQYVYKSDQNITVQNNAPVSRTLQKRLDDNVTTTDFGTLGNYDPNTGLGVDDTNALQFAINQLFLNASSKASATGSSSVSARVILSIPAGTFRLRSTLYVPSFASLIGAGKDKTIIYYDPITTTVTGSLIQSGGSTLLASASITSAMVGMHVTGTNITGNTVVTSVVPGVSATLSVNATSIGSGTWKLTPNSPAIQFVNDDSIIGTVSPLSSTRGNTQPRNIQISDLTINDITGMNTCLQLDAVKNSLFENLNLIGSDGTYGKAMDAQTSTYNDFSCGMTLNVNSSIVTTEHNIFRNIDFSGFSYCVQANGDILNNIFEECYFSNSRQGVTLGVGADGTSTGQQYGPRQTQIVNSKFYFIMWHGVQLGLGEFNTVSDCSFINVGTNGTSNTYNGSDAVRHPQIYLGSHNNTTTNIKSDRYDDLETANFSVVYTPVVTGHGVVKSYNTRSIYLSGSSGPFLRLPVCTDSSGAPTGSISYEIDYMFKNTVSGAVYTRSGTLFVTADLGTNWTQLADEYNFAGVDSNIDALAAKLNFAPQLLDSTGTYTSQGGNPAYSLKITYDNSSVAVGGYFVYSYRAIM